MRNGCATIVLLCVGLLFGGIGGYIGRENMNFVSTAKSATGKIIDVEQSRDSDGDRTYRPVVRFTPSEGDSVVFTGDVGSSSRPRVGETVKVLYQPRNPEQAKIDSFFELWLLPGIFGLIGGIMLLISAFMILRLLVLGALVARAAVSG